MSVNIKLGNNIVNNVSTIKVKDASDQSLLHSFSLPLKPNIHFSSSVAPTDTSKLWVKTDAQPDKIQITTVGGTTADNYLSPLSAGGTKGCIYGYYAYCVHKGKIYYSASTWTGSSYILHVYCYDTATNTFSVFKSSIATFSSSFTVGGMFVIDNNLWLVNVGNTSTYYSTYKIDLETLVVTTASELICYYGGTAVHGGRAALFGRRIFIAGATYVSSSRAYRVTASFSVFDVDLNGYVYHNKSSQIQTQSTVLVRVVGDYFYIIYTGDSNTNRKVYITKVNANDYTYVTNKEIYTITTESYGQLMGCGSIGSDLYFTIETQYSAALYKYDTINDQTSVIISNLKVGSYHVEYGCVNGEDNKIYLMDQTASWFTVDAYVDLAENNLLIITNTAKSDFNIINLDSLTISINPYCIYLGDSDNKAQYISAALYDEVNQEWIWL